MMYMMIFTFSNLISESDSEQSSMLTAATPREALGKTADVGVGVEVLIRSTLSSLSLEFMKKNHKKCVFFISLCSKVTHEKSSLNLPARGDIFM